MVFTAVVVAVAVLTPFTLTAPVPHAQIAYAQGAPPTEANLTPVNNTCGWTGAFTNPSRCIFLPAASFIGALFLVVFSAFLTFAGYIFDWVFIHTVTDLGGTLQTIKIMSGITATWSAFRDIGNILMIGMLAFISISMILGIQSYGSRSLIVRVLIVAALINFSLFFSQIIIDASNFVAHQFFTSIQTSNGTTDKNATIANAFVNKMGVKGVWDTKASLEAMVQNPDKGVGASSIWPILGFSIVGSFMFIAVTAILLYGAFLMLSRAVLLVFLMVTSSVAFASYLVPKLKGWGWDRWWDSLFQASFFGPLLTLFLWASLVILNKVEPVGGTSSLGTIVASAGTKASVDAWKAIVIFAVVVGFLYASIKAASSLSGQITGMGAARKGVAWTGLTTFAAGSRVTGLAARSTVGKMSNKAYESMRERGYRDSGLGRQLLRASSYLGTSSFDAMGTKGMQQAAKSVGAVRFGDEKVGKGGHIATKERQAKAALEEAQKFAPKTHGKARVEKKAAAQALTENDVTGKRQIIATKERELATLESQKTAKNLDGEIKTLHQHMADVPKTVGAPFDERIKREQAALAEASRHIDEKYSGNIDGLQSQIKDSVKREQDQLRQISDNEKRQLGGASTDAEKEAIKSAAEELRKQVQATASSDRDQIVSRLEEIQNKRSSETRIATEESGKRIEKIQVEKQTVIQTEQNNIKVKIDSKENERNEQDAKISAVRKAVTSAHADLKNAEAKVSSAAQSAVEENTVEIAQKIAQSRASNILGWFSNNPNDAVARLIRPELTKQQNRKRVKEMVDALEIKVPESPPAANEPSK